MQIELESCSDLQCRDFEKYSFLPWNSRLVDQHAEAKYESFCDELDSHVFPCLGDPDGCLNLMKEISCRKGFTPSATWLLVYQPPGQTHIENCGTVQGIQHPGQLGSIQNLGVARSHRGQGLGAELLRRALLGFITAAVKTVSLEVTAHNDSALKLYEKVGFQVTEVVYKSADLVY